MTGVYPEAASDTLLVNVTERTQLSKKILREWRTLTVVARGAAQDLRGPPPQDLHHPGDRLGEGRGQVVPFQGVGVQIKNLERSGGDRHKVEPFRVGGEDDLEVS